MSATHIGMPSAAGMPDSFVIMSHLLACVPRRSITRSKSDIGTVAPGVSELSRLGGRSVPGGRGRSRHVSINEPRMSKQEKARSGSVVAAEERAFDDFADRLPAIAVELHQPHLL